MTLHAHEPIPAELFVLGGPVNDEFDVTVGVQHDPCCPGQVCIGVPQEDHDLDVADIDLDRDQAHRTALAILAAVAHIDHPEWMDGRGGGTDEEWQDAHAEARHWVSEHPEFVSQLKAAE